MDETVIFSKIRFPFIHHNLFGTILIEDLTSLNITTMNFTHLRRLS